MTPVVTPPPCFADDLPNRFRWRSKQFYDLARLGLFARRTVQLLDGVIYDKPPSDPAGPQSAPIQFTPEEFRQLDELGCFVGRRVELEHGQVVEMSPRGWSHVVGHSNAAAVLGEAFAGVAELCDESPFPADDSVLVPDIVVIPGRRADRPLLVVEVADETRERDATTKAGVYAAAGVADYWVLDVVGNELLVFRDPVAVPDGGAVYQDQAAYGRGDTVAPLAAPTAAVRVADLLP